MSKLGGQASTINPVTNDLEPSFVDVASFVEMTDIQGCGPRLTSEPAGHFTELPRTLEVYMAFLGLKEWRPIASAPFNVAAACHPRSSNRRRLSKAYLWTIRGLVFAVCFYSVFSGVCPKIIYIYFFPMLRSFALTPLLLYQVIAYAVNVDDDFFQEIRFACSKSSTIDPSAPPPCLLLLAYQGLLPMFGIGAGVVYLWLLFYGSSESSLLKSHRTQCTPRVSTFFFFCLLR
jgi:hypothetical protein